MDSAKFTTLVAQNERDARDIVFLIGGPDGLPPEWKPRADLLLGLAYKERQADLLVAEGDKLRAEGARNHLLLPSGPLLFNESQYSSLHLRKSTQKGCCASQCLNRRIL